MTEFEVEKDDSFTIVTNNILRNKNLSMSAKGLLCTIFSLPPEWDYSFNGLVAICKEGKAAVRNAINELKDSKYIKISQSRNEKGYYQYKYTVYRKPYEEIQKNEFHPTPGYRTTDYRTSDNQPQLNTNKLIDKIDKYDKTKNTQPEHNYLTKELLKLNYISESDSSSFLFDDLFTNYLDNGFTFGNIISSIHYIVPRVISRNFIDEDGNEIKNKYGYFKSAFESNVERFNNMPEELYSEKDEDYEL
jgi:hypothetical protein